MIFHRDHWTPERLHDLVSDTRTFAQNVRDDLSTARATIDELRADVNALQAQQNRAAIVTVLPTNAPLGSLIRLQGDLTGALYLGNGPTRALTKLLPTVL